MRLDRFLADATDASRSDVKAWLRAGRVTVNHACTRRAGTRLGRDDRVYLDDREVLAVPARYLMLHKPAGTVCTAADSDPRSVLRLVPQSVRRPLQCVGRLDVDTTGLLLLTDDGQWNHRMIRPGSRLKVYRASLAGSLSDEAQQQLLSGVVLKGETTPAVARSIERIDDLTINLAVDEGRYHMVKRMIAAVGNRVLHLHRESVGGLVLDPLLDSGAWRELTDDEVSAG